MKTTTQEKIKEEYQRLVESFAKDIRDLDYGGIPAPHIPIAGEHFDEAYYKIAFMGMETYGWGNMQEFITAAEENPGKAVLMYNKWFNPEGMLGHDGNATFFGFIIRFLARFYHIDLQTIKNKSSLHPVLTSIIWGNTNAIERYEVTAAKKGVDRKDWAEVKKRSVKLDSINHLINAAKPKIVFVTYKWVNENYLLNENDIASDICGGKKYAFTYEIDDDGAKYRYYYLRDQDTHVFVLPHPRWIGLYGGGYDKYIDSLIKTIRDLKIWPALPSCEQDWRKQDVNKSSQRFKYNLIAKLANTLIDQGVTMSGIQLQQIFNMNEIRTSYGTRYGSDGGRGIHRVIKCAWQHYYKKGELQTALNIARAFTGKYGNYTY